MALDYIVVTACKNEEKNILLLANSIINQTIIPQLWLIVDDGSTDSTPGILEYLKTNNKWISTITLQKGKRDLGFHYAKIVNLGLSSAFQICKEDKIFFDYVGLIDADMILNHNFFETIIYEFKKNPNLGIASGWVAYKKGKKLFLEKGRDNNEPIGGLRVWCKNCLLETGGFPISYSADWVSNVLARMKGWNTAKYKEIYGIQTRRTSSAEGLWEGYKRNGEADYYLDLHYLYICYRFLRYISSYPSYTGIAYIYGYIYGIVTIKRKIEDIEIRKYFHNRHKEIFKYYLNKLR
jgi:glycosyltransferase involved in cell wall biosynthesis